MKSIISFLIFLLCYVNSKYYDSNNISDSDNKKILLVNQKIEYNNKSYIINLIGESTFGDNWGSSYGARLGKLTVSPPLEINGLNEVLLPKENKSLMQFFSTFWNFMPKLEIELNKLNQTLNNFYFESLSFESFNHPDKWWINISINGILSNLKHTIIIEYNRPEDGPGKEEIMIQRK